MTKNTSIGRGENGRYLKYTYSVYVYEIPCGRDVL